tara:strand:- start:591 stop:1334 length:744 start_codon:yes stop_codon:yes gene_type:complete
MKKIIIHQPDFIPWLGFFHKLSLCDEFIVFDHVQISNGKSWSSRNQILLNNSPFWITIPVIKKNKQKINETKINYQSNFVRKHLGTFRQAYQKAPFFNEIFPIIESVYSNNFEYLVDFNMDSINKICDELNINFNITNSSKLVNDMKLDSKLKGNDLVLKICIITNCKKYFSGRGCLDFIKPNKFNESGIDFYFQHFIHPTYPQNNSDYFISHLSIIDSLMYLGFDGVSTLIKKQKKSYQHNKCTSL